MVYKSTERLIVAFKVWSIGILAAIVVSWLDAATRLATGGGASATVWGHQVFLTILEGLIFGGSGMLFVLWFWSFSKKISLLPIVYLAVATVALTSLTLISDIPLFGTGTWILTRISMYLLPVLAGPLFLWFTSQDLLKDWLEGASASSPRS